MSLPEFVMNLILKKINDDLKKHFLLLKCENFSDQEAIQIFEVKNIFKYLVFILKIQTKF
jgi:hypothetical protein